MKIFASWSKTNPQSFIQHIFLDINKHFVFGLNDSCRRPVSFWEYYLDEDANNPHRLLDSEPFPEPTAAFRSL